MTPAQLRAARAFLALPHPELANLPWRCFTDDEERRALVSQTRKDLSDRPGDLGVAAAGRLFWLL
jgi:hypothetical protein